MRISEGKEFLKRSFELKRKVLVISKPGTGKTFAKRQVAKELGWRYIGVSAPLLSPVKIGGYPVQPKTEGGDALHAPFGAFAQAFRATEPTVFDIDDLLVGCGVETLKCLLDFVQFGTIDGKQLPDCVVVSASTNDIGHGAEVTGMIEPLKLRWDTIVTFETHIDDVIPYGIAAGWPACLLGYLRNSPKSLDNWKPSKSIFPDGACPRAWEHVAEWVNGNVLDHEVIAGCVGKGEATAYLSYRDFIGELPDITQVLIDPMGAPVPENPSAVWLISMTLASQMTGQNFGQCLRYLQRLKQMFRAMSILDAITAEKSRLKEAGGAPKGWSPISACRDFIAWSCTQDGKEITGSAAVRSK